MGINKAINQDKFISEKNKLLINILYTNNWLQTKMKAFFETYDLTSQQYNILRILRGAKMPMSTLKIRERMIDRMSDTSRLVERLLNKGLVQKTVCNKDKRLVDVVITEQGLNLLAEMDYQEKLLDDIFRNISDNDAVELNGLLDKIRVD
ncbi:MarR family winged helix-turn-helix transcriptional regulator [Polluticaenibacter yanchengensis]|uniref:MarR family transcriptional regulator n=1 Tax=Polluticaenibacter yanchengensis TaxID=3014562 RepID=A0ABT4UME5_9BACT|nr:MarR family transcriptional regulator [Chitinophagaceae bacterium LY-5]